MSGADRYELVWALVVPAFSARDGYGQLVVKGGGLGLHQKDSIRFDERSLSVCLFSLLRRRMPRKG